MTRADGRLLFPEREGIERAPKFSKHDLDDDEIFVALFINGENFGYDGSHLRQFLCSTKTKQKSKRTSVDQSARPKDCVTAGTLGRGTR